MLATPVAATAPHVIAVQMPPRYNADGVYGMSLPQPLRREHARNSDT